MDSLFPGEVPPPVTARSLGTKSELKALFPEIRGPGYALNDEEYAEGISGVATRWAPTAPIVSVREALTFPGPRPAGGRSAARGPGTSP
ncbi:hypothetical protein [Streptomyces sp. 5-6(2022)]|uniref:hypothetical protein n=1 Tax=Streptomyces sp. 5-6(2022) TaxID=2936510 RepID=UPI0023BA3978|nr:hypothetical protein [Streptomyces sp. 5-6(2022)]